MVFLKTARGKKFFEWYVRKIVVDFVRRLKASYDLNHEAGFGIMKDAIVCNVSQVLQQYKQLELVSGDKDHKLALYNDQCKDLTDKFISGGGLSDAFMYESWTW